MSVSREASHRIRRFSIGVGVLAAVSAVASVAIVVGAGMAHEAQLAMRSPWLQETIVEAEQAAGTHEWSADGSARIALPDELRGVPLSFDLTSGSSVDVFLGDVTDPDSSPRYLGGGYPSSMLPFGAYADSEVWVAARGPWTATLTPLDTEPVAQEASGDADDVLVIAGDVSTAHLRWEGDGRLWVVVRTLGGNDQMHSSEDEGSGAVDLEWTPSEFVVIEIHAYDGVRWTVTVDDLGELAVVLGEATR